MGGRTYSAFLYPFKTLYKKVLLNIFLACLGKNDVHKIKKGNMYLFAVKKTVRCAKWSVVKLKHTSVQTNRVVAHTMRMSVRQDLELKVCSAL
jgi:hypothetical protein